MENQFAYNYNCSSEHHQNGSGVRHYNVKIILTAIDSDNVDSINETIHY